MRLLLFLLLIVLSLACNERSTTAWEGPALIFQNVNIIDPIDGLRANQTVVVADGEIVQITDQKNIATADSDVIVDGTGKYLMPGLWDAHVHFAYIEPLAPSMFNLFLAYGITSVRDTGGDIELTKKWRAAAEAQAHRAPRVKIAGPLLDGLPNVYDGSSPDRPGLSVGLGTVASVDTMVDVLLKEHKVDFLKAYEMLTPEQFTAVAQKAKANGVKVTGHIPLSMDVISAADAGLNSVEHLRNLELSCAANSEVLLSARRRLLEEGKEDQGGVLRSRIHTAQRMEAIRNQDPDKTAAVLAALADNDTWQIPTLALMSNLTRGLMQKPGWQQSFNYLPDSIARAWKTQSAAIVEGPINPASKEYADWLLGMTGKIHQAEIGIMAGTDCPIFFLTPGYSLHEELQLLAEAGLTPLEVLQTATVRPAAWFGMEKLGRVQEQMLADLVLLNANPLDDISNTLQIEAVVRQGNVHTRADLDAMLAAAAQ